MKTVLLTALFALSMTAFPVLAADERGGQGDSNMAQKNTAPTHVGHGKVISVDSQAGTVKLTHDPMKTLKWPKMTMDFKVHDAAMLKDIKPGAQVNFELMKMDGAYHIMKITPSATSKDTKESHNAHDSEHAHGHSAAGRPGNPAKISRTIEVTAVDIKYDKAKFDVKAGETIKFVVTNTGKLRHEFMIGDAEEQKAHAEMMKKMPDMVHADANTLSLEPAETKSLIWQFTKPGILEVACHIPGHYEAGMVSKVVVKNK